MIAVDTNVLVRLVTADDPGQAQRAAELFERERIFVPKTVWLELAWVLSFSYGLAPAVIQETLRRVLGLPQVTAEDAETVLVALERFAAGMDFADALHLASSAAAEAFATFDVRLHKRAGVGPEVRLL